VTKIFTSISKDISKCNYLDLTETDQIKSIANIPESLILIHLNTRSLNKNFDELYDFISSLPITPNVICLSEFRIKNQSQRNIDLTGYKIIKIMLVE